MMRKTVFKAVALMCSVALFTACSDDTKAWGDGSGRIVPSVDIDTRALTSRSEIASSSLSASDLQITLSKSDGSYKHTWQSVSEFPIDQKFTVGQYKIEASYGDPEEEGFDKPAFYGSKDLVVNDNETTSVALTASLSNCMIDIAYTDEFKAYMQAWSANVHSSKGNYIYYSADETAAAYFYPGHATVDVAVTRPDGKQATFEVADFNTEARNYYHVTVGLTNGASDAALTVTFEGVEGSETFVVDLSDEIMKKAAPVLNTYGFTSGDEFVHLAGEAYIGDLYVDIFAQGKMKTLTLTTHSKSLTNQGWPAEIDLLSASASDQGVMKALGLQAQGVFGNKDGIAARVNFANVIKNIQLLSSDNTTSFTLVVKDEYNKVSDPVVVTFNIQDVTLSLASDTPMVAGDPTLTLLLTYNGADPASNVKFQYKNERGSWTNITPISIEATATQFVYRVKFNAPYSDSDIVIRAIRGATVSQEVTSSPSNPNLSVSSTANDTFATYALLDVASDEIDVNANGSLVKAYVSTDGSHFTKATSTMSAGGVLTLTGLTPATAYTVKVGVKEGVENATGQCTLTTEAATAVPNAGMETWYRQALSSQYQWIDYPGADANAVWGTMNLLTTSENGTGNSIVSYGGASYRAFSGTQPSTDKHNGTYSAYIATVGWGKGNTAGGNVSRCQNLTVGQLYLGQYDTSSKAPVYGYSFASRPKSMTFYYKYVPYNSADYGTAEISVLDASGNVLATASQNLSSASAFTAVTLPLTYSRGASKAANIKVIFKSSGNSECQSINTSNLSYPAFANYTDGRFTGSELYIDDITLNY